MRTVPFSNCVAVRYGIRAQGFSSDEEADLDSAQEASPKASPGALLAQLPSFRGPKTGSFHEGGILDLGLILTKTGSFPARDTRAGPEAGAELCVACATVTADGDFDLDDGNW